MSFFPHKNFSEACDSFIKSIAALAFQMMSCLAYQKEQRENFELRSKIKNREQGYRQFVKSMPFPINIVSKSNGVIFQNIASLEDPLLMNMASFNDAIDCLKNRTGQSLKEIFNEMKVEESENSFSKLHEETFFAEYSCSSSSRSIKAVYNVSLSVTPPMLGYSDVFTFIMCDNTLKKEYEEQIMAEKYKNILLCSFSHELRTPINIVIGTLKALKNVHGGKPDPSTLLSAYNMAVTLSWKINEMIDMVQLHFGDFELHPEPVDVNSMAHKLITL